MPCLCRAISLTVVLAAIIAASTFSQNMPELTSNHAPQSNQCCECQSGSGPFKAPLPPGYGANVCPGTCAASGGRATGRVVSCVTAPANPAPNKIPLDNSLCFSKGGAAGNCNGNNWCTCGTSQVYLFDDKEQLVEPHKGIPLEAGFIWVLVNQKVKIRADVSGFGGSVSQYRKELGPPQVTIRFGENRSWTGPFTVGAFEEFPLPGLSVNPPSPPKPQFITHSWSKPGTYIVFVYETGYYHWSAEDGSCSYSCVSQPDCPGNNYLMIYVVDKPKSPGKKYPSADPE
jgi:hypothetical protein